MTPQTNHRQDRFGHGPRNLRGPHHPKDHRHQNDEYGGVGVARNLLIIRRCFEMADQYVMSVLKTRYGDAIDNLVSLWNENTLPEFVDLSASFVN